MSEPKRYKVGKIGTTEMIDCVSYEDYARLKAEVERLKEGNECLDQMHEKEMARSAFLCEQVERLTAENEQLQNRCNFLEGRQS